MKTVTTAAYDSIRLEKGTGITDILVLPEKKYDAIITGQINIHTRRYTCPEFEPEIQADILNRQNQSLLAASYHHDCITASPVFPK